MALVNKNIILRAVEPEDLEWFYRWENDPDVWNISHTLRPYSRFMLRQYIQSAHEDIYKTRQLRFMIDLLVDPQGTIGTIDLFDFDPFHLRAGVGILIAEEKHRNKGYGTRALETLIKYVFENMGFHQLWCNILENNKESLRLFQNLGFETIGLKKQWIRSGSHWLDEYLLQLIRKQTDPRKKKGCRGRQPY